MASEEDLRVSCPKCGVKYKWRADMARKKVLCLCGMKFRMPFQSNQDVIIVTPEGEEVKASVYFAQQETAGKSGPTPPVPGSQSSAMASGIELNVAASAPTDSGSSGTMLAGDILDPKSKALGPIPTKKPEPVRAAPVKVDADADKEYELDLNISLDQPPAEPPPTPAPAAPLNHCPKCNAPVEESALICISCGANLVVEKKSSKTEKKKRETVPDDAATIKAKIAAMEAKPRAKTDEEIEIEKTHKVKAFYAPIILCVLGLLLMAFNAFYVAPIDDKAAEDRRKASEAIDAQNAAKLGEAMGVKPGAVNPFAPNPGAQDPTAGNPDDSDDSSDSPDMMSPSKSDDDDGSADDSAQTSRRKHAASSDDDDGSADDSAQTSRRKHPAASSDDDDGSADDSAQTSRRKHPAASSNDDGSADDSAQGSHRLPTRHYHDPLDTPPAPPDKGVIVDPDAAPPPTHKLRRLSDIVDPTSQPAVAPTSAPAPTANPATPVKHSKKHTKKPKKTSLVVSVAATKPTGFFLGVRRVIISLARAVAQILCGFFGLHVIVKLFGEAFDDIPGAIMKLTGLAMVMVGIDACMSSGISILTDGFGSIAGMFSESVTFAFFWGFTAYLFELGYLETVVFYLVSYWAPVLVAVTLIGFLIG